MEAQTDRSQNCGGNLKMVYFARLLQQPRRSSKSDQLLNQVQEASEARYAWARAISRMC